MIFWLEIDGEMKKAFVREPYSSEMALLNYAKKLVRSDEEAHDLLSARLKQKAAEAVADNAYEVIG